MKMSKKKGNDNMYDFVDVRSNPLGGKCYHDCSYCSTKRFSRYPNIAKKYSGAPFLDAKQLKNWGENKTIFMVSQNDLFADNVHDEIITNIIKHVEKYPNNRYYFQTKNTKRMLEYYGQFDGLKNNVFCTTLETNRHYPEFMVNSPKPTERSVYFSLIDCPEKEVTIEPIMDFDMDEFVQMIKDCKPKAINIGADSGNNHLPEPSREKVLELIERLKEFTEVKRKTNLKRILDFNQKPKFELDFCEKCFQMTNHLNGVCAKCSNLEIK